MKNILLQEKIAGIAVKCGDLVEKRLDEALKNENEKIDFQEINEGIQTIHQIVAALWKLGACGQEGTDTRKYC